MLNASEGVSEEVASLGLPFSRTAPVPLDGPKDNSLEFDLSDLAGLDGNTVSPGLGEDSTQNMGLRTEGHDIVEARQPRPAVGIFRRGEDLDAAVFHLRDKVEVVGARLLHPEHVVEQQPVAVGWRQAFVRQAGRAGAGLHPCACLSVVRSAR